MSKTIHQVITDNAGHAHLFVWDERGLAFGSDLTAQELADSLQALADGDDARGWYSQYTPETMAALYAELTGEAAPR